MKRPKISVLLCTYRPWPSILWNIQSLQRQTFKSWELVLAQHGVVLDSYLPEWIRDKTTSLYFEHDGVYRPVRIRNLSWRECRGRLIFFMHDYVRLKGRDYLKKLWKRSESARYAVSTTKVLVETRPALADEPKWAHRSQFGVFVGRHTPNHGFYLHQDAVPRKFLNAINGFDPVYDPPQGSHGHDDLDTKDSLAEVGCSIMPMEELISVKLSVQRLYPLKGDSDVSNQWVYHRRGERERIFKKRQQ